MEDDAGSTLEQLDGPECYRLLAQGTVGRVAVLTADDDAPLVVPVNYALDGHAIVFRTDAGTTLAAVRRHRVSFEVDDLDTVHRAGWSVLVRGYAREATEWEAAHVLVAPWAPGRRDHWVRIEPDDDGVTGRRIPVATADTDARGYI